MSRFSSFVSTVDDPPIFTLPSGEQREMSVVEAAELDSPEGAVIVKVSATLYAKLLEEHQELQKRRRLDICRVTER